MPAGGPAGLRILADRSITRHLRVYKNSVSGECLTVRSAEGGGDCGKKGNLIREDVERKDLPLPAVLLAGRLTSAT